MGQKNRVSQLMASDIACLLDRAENPELAIEQLIGDLEESIVDLHARKRALAESILDGSEVSGSLTVEDVRALLGAGLADG